MWHLHISVNGRKDILVSTDKRQTCELRKGTLWPCGGLGYLYQAIPAGAKPPCKMSMGPFNDLHPCAKFKYSLW